MRGPALAVPKLLTGWWLNGDPCLERRLCRLPAQFLFYSFSLSQLDDTLQSNE